MDVELVPRSNGAESAPYERVSGCLRGYAASRPWRASITPLDGAQVRSHTDAVAVELCRIGLRRLASLVGRGSRVRLLSFILTNDYVVDLVLHCRANRVVG